MFQTFISRHYSNFFSDKVVLTSATPASSAPVLQTPSATSSTLFFTSLIHNVRLASLMLGVGTDCSSNNASQPAAGGAETDGSTDADTSAGSVGGAAAPG